MTSTMISRTPTDDREEHMDESGRSAGHLSSFRLIAMIAGREIATQFRRKELWGSLIITVVVLVGALGVQKLFSGAASSYTVGIAGDQAAVSAALTEQQVVGIDVVALPADADPAGSIEAGELDAVLGSDGRVIVPDSPPGELIEVIQQANSAVTSVESLRAAGLDDSQITGVFSVDPLAVVSLDADAAVKQEQTVTAIVAVMILFFLMFMFGQAIAQGVLEEKSSRIVEVLLAKVRAWHLLTGKVIGVGAVVLTQMVAILVAGMVGAVAFGVVDAPADMARIGGIVLLWFIPGYFLFATMWALAGALVSRPEDLNHAAGPVSFLQTLGLVGALVPFIGLDRSLAQVLSLLPGTSWAVMPVRMATETVPLWEIATSLGLMLVAIAVMLRVGGRIYAGGVLEHGGMLKAKTALRIARDRGLS